MTSKVALLIAGLIVVLAVTAGIVFAVVHHRSKMSNPTVTTSNGLRYLPLGDSYTIGQSISESGRWPNQLVDRLNEQGTKLQIVANPSVTGYTTQNLIDKELPLVAKYKPQFVTILIGVNDYVQGVDASTFQANLNHILDVVQQQMASPQRIVLITIPDYGRTPTGAEFGSPDVSHAGILNFNKIITQTGAARNIPVADIFPTSEAVAADPTLIAPDGLHPTAKEYTAWTNVILQTINDSKILAGAN